MDWFHFLIEIPALLGVVLTVLTIPTVLLIKKDATSAMAWCLLVFFLPIFGSIFFLLFGYQSVHRPLKRKQRHKERYRQTVAPDGPQEDHDEPRIDPAWEGMANLVRRFGGFPVTYGNDVAFYHEGRPAFDALLDALRSARQHIHLEYFIFKADRIGTTLLDVLTQKAKEGVEVRLLYDAMGSRTMRHGGLSAFHAAGGRSSVFLPVSLLRRRIQVNLRDHRKIAVIDGRVAFTGGLNVGDEYLGEVERFGFWRDTHLRLEGPAVASLQRIFIEGWDFAADERLQGAAYFPPPVAGVSEGPRHYPVQVIQSGPDQQLKTIREVYFAAILRARRRLWIASPYFVPDAGLLDGLCLAGYLGVDVRLLCQYHPDKWIPYYTGRFYWSDVLAAGVKVYQYTKGMMHAKVVVVDGEWASVGTANMDNRSLHLNFEVNCLFYTPEGAAELERAFQHDLASSIQLDPEVFARRPVAGRLAENASRLLSPVL